jgi:DNA-binding NtrC family response regulator
MLPTRLVHAKRTSARVLIVDDEESICALLARMLEPLGYEIDTLTDADSALASVNESPADVVVADIRMPGHDGVWLIDQLQRLHPATAVVIVTGIQDLDPRLTLRPGVIAYLAKPFEAEQVQTAVKKAVDAVRALQPRPQLRLVPPPPGNTPS